MGPGCSPGPTFTQTPGMPAKLSHASQRRTTSRKLATPSPTTTRSIAGDSKSRGAKAYLALAGEVIRRQTGAPFPGHDGYPEMEQQVEQH